MCGKINVSSQLRSRRKEPGFSLVEVARRAGTSAATLSRYENGWSRFETYTFRKLATALGCDLRIDLVPRPSTRSRGPRREKAIQCLARLFWDHKLVEQDLDRHLIWVFERVLEYGRLDDIERDTASEVCGWTLAGGAGLALRFGHRRSEDLGFFRTEEMDVRDLHPGLARYGPYETLQGEAHAIVVLP